jgi:hypothetical protein
MKGILKKTEKGWMVIYDEILGKGIVKKNQNALPLHPDNEESLIEDNEVEFEIVMDKPDHTYSQTPYAKIINEGVNDGVSEGVKKLSFKERCRIANYTPFNIENLMGELSKMKKEAYLTQEEFEEFHHTIMDGLNIPRYGK